MILLIFLKFLAFIFISGKYSFLTFGIISFFSFLFLLKKQLTFAEFFAVVAFYFFIMILNFFISFSYLYIQSYAINAEFLNFEYLVKRVFYDYSLITKVTPQYIVLFATYFLIAFIHWFNLFKDSWSKFKEVFFELELYKSPNYYVNFCYFLISSNILYYSVIFAEYFFSFSFFILFITFCIDRYLSVFKESVIS